MSRVIKTINREVGGRIKQQRISQGLTREQLARLTGYSANFIQEVERGRSGLSSESIRAFSTALRVSSDHLLFGTASESFGFLLAKLDTVPRNKRKHIFRIIEAAIDCAMEEHTSPDRETKTKGDV